MKLNEFLYQLSTLSESGIRIPKGTHAAKIIHHEDFDGVFSAIITYRQLIKQGISPEHITIEGIQYSDMPAEIERKLSKSKGQMVALVDFARIPEDGSQPDFWSDHHPSEKSKSSGGARIGASEFKSDSMHLATLHTENMVDGQTLDVVNKIDSAGYTDLKEILKLPKDFKQARRLERLGILCNALLTKSGILKNTSLLEQFVKETKPSIVSFYNNILKYVRLHDIQEEAIEELEKENPDWGKIEKSRRRMPTLKSKSKIQRHVESINEEALEDEEELERLKAKGSKRTKEEEKRFKELINKPIENLRQRRAATAEKERSGEGSFEDRGIALIQHNPHLQRYLWTQMNKAGVKFPFVIKRYGTMIQVAANPELPEVVKKKVDLNEVANDVMKMIRDKFQNKYNTWAFKIIDSERGGHKGITNIPAFGTLGIMKKDDRGRLKYLQSLEDRIKKLKSKKDMGELMPKKAKELEELEAKKKKFAEKRTQIMNEVENEFIRILDEKFGDVNLKGGEKEYEFEDIETLFRSVLNEAKRKKLLLLDVDDTIVKPKEIHIYKKTPEGEVALSPEEFAKETNPDSSVYDFRDFKDAKKISDSISKGQPILKVLKYMDRMIAKGYKIGILTARAHQKAMQDTMTSWLMYRKKGKLREIGNKLQEVFAVNDAVMAYRGANSAEKKANVIQDLANVYDTIVFVDDDKKNIEAVENLNLQNVKTKHIKQI